MVANVPPLERDTLTLMEFAELLGMSYTTIHLLAQQNRLPVPVSKIGRQYRISRVAYRRWLERQHDQSDDAA
jgi:excisionase family DNA binding protein